jgi:CDP-glucose 4,6-dehydratase
VKIPGRVQTTIDQEFWAGRRVLVTGHTGFKGSWLALWLKELGAEVVGAAPGGPPTRPSLYELARVGEGIEERKLDVRNAAAVRKVVAETRPEIVMHLAAQPLVRHSYEEPRDTFEVNVTGTVNVLEAVRLLGEEVKAVVVVTSDKCYDNPTAHPAAGGAEDPSAPPHRNGRRFVEGDPLGGRDPYSASKACAEIVTASYRDSFFSARGAPRVASARAGNVIGGGDWGAERLIPDIVRAVEEGVPVKVRSPDAVRPWQHVLNPLGGYIRLAQALWEGQEAAGAWNFGPAQGDVRTVGWIVERMAERWEGALRWEIDGEPADPGKAAPPEAGYLALDSGKAERLLGWRPAWDLEEAIGAVVEWHSALRSGEDARQTTVCQIERFDRMAVSP